MYRPFFPNADFAWGFLAVLGLILAVAAYVDFRRMVIPKWITLSMLAIGFLMNLARGIWLGIEGGNLWIFPTYSGWLGALDGLLFALVGAIVGFTMLFVLWLLGTCGGGDVKLFAALGAWIGPIYSMYVLLVSLAVLAALLALKAVSGGISFKTLRQSSEYRKKRAEGKAPPPLKNPPKWRISYSFPVAVATVVVLMWAFRVELNLTFLNPQPARVVAHER